MNKKQLRLLFDFIALGLLIYLIFNLGAQTYMLGRIMEHIEQCEVVNQTVINEVKEECEEQPLIITLAEYQPNTQERELPNVTQGEFKTYMDYRTITDTTSKQYALQRLAVTDEEGFRKFNGRYMVAVGTYYAQEVGKEFVIQLESGKQIDVIVGDIKDDRHTDENNQYIPINGNIVEFIIDKEVMDELPLKLGDVSVLGLEGCIVSIKEVLQ